MSKPKSATLKSTPVSAKSPKAEVRKRPAAPTKVDAPMAKDVSAFLARVQAKKVRSVGLLRVATATQMSQRAKPGAVPHFDPAALAAATGTLFIGKDGSGARFFVERHAARSEVFIHDPGGGQLAFVADSLASFLELNELMDEWQRFCEAHDVDPDPEALDDIDKRTPGFAEIRASARSLLGRLHLTDRSDFDETMEALAKAKFRLKPKSSVLARYEAAKRAHLQPR